MVRLLIELEAQVDAVSERRSNALFRATSGGSRLPLTAAVIIQMYFNYFLGPMANRIYSTLLKYT